MEGRLGFLLLLCVGAVLGGGIFKDKARLGLEDGVVTCSICRTVMEEALTWINAGDSREELVDKFTAACSAVGIPEQVCRGVTELNIDVMLFILVEKNQTETPLTPKDACGFALYPDCNLEGYDWTLNLDFLGPKPAPEEPETPPNGSPTLKVLQLTDVHVDPMYLPGGNAVCGLPICCRSDQGEPATPEDAAGYWGDYRECDLPVHTLENLLKHASSNNPDVSYVMFTGDIVDHSVWSTSNQYNTDLITMVTNLIGEYFPGVPVLPIFGNHESNPTNVFSPDLPQIPSEISSAWIYELAADLWGQWLPASTRETILRGGFYTVEVNSGLQAIVMNSMFCYNYNWWLMYDNVDPSGELMWLAETLLAAENNNMKVHILMHHTSGNKDCMHMWSSQYRRIIDRFENIVMGQFHGHTHNDHFSIQYDINDSDRATNVAFTAGSGTSYSDVNMNYRLYTVDGDYQGASYQVLDHETWYFNLTEANLAGSDVEPNWQKLYSFNDAYNTASLRPMEMDTLVKRMIDDPALQEQYYGYYVKLGDPELEAGCDRQCNRELMCQILTTVNGDESKCNQLLP